MSLEPEAHGPGHNGTELCLRSIAISLKRIADMLEQQMPRPEAPKADTSWESVVADNTRGYP